MTAAELALGVLEGEERATALRRVLADPAFAREVGQWRDHFGTLFGLWPQTSPRDEVRERLARSLSPMREHASTWRGVATAAMLLAALLLAVLLLRPSAVPQLPIAAPTLVASLSQPDGDPVTAIYQASTGEIRIPAMTFHRAGRSAQLWMIGADGVPRSLGLMDASKPSVFPVPVPARRLLVAGIKLAISSEPRGGSTTGGPTGPILASGVLISV